MICEFILLLLSIRSKGRTETMKEPCRFDVESMRGRNVMGKLLLGITVYLDIIIWEHSTFSVDFSFPPFRLHLVDVGDDVPFLDV